MHTGDCWGDFSRPVAGDLRHDPFLAQTGAAPPRSVGQTDVDRCCHPSPTDALIGLKVRGWLCRLPEMRPRGHSNTHTVTAITSKYMYSVW